MTDFSTGFGDALMLGRRPLVLSVDLMHAYFDRGSPLCLPWKSSLSSAVREIDAARHAVIPVVHTSMVFGVGGADAGLFFHKMPALKLFVGENEMNEIMPEVEPRDDELVLVRQYPSAFFGTSLASTLQSNGFDTLVIVGVTTSVSIRATAVDAMQHGFFSAVVQDAVGDSTNEVHESNLFDIGAKFSEVASESTIIDYLRRPR